jgi:hypothetical protein
MRQKIRLVKTLKLKQMIGIANRVRALKLNKG